MVTQQQLDQLYSECQKLPKSSVIEEEAHVFGSPLLIAMSTVLSLNRKWYSHALPARKRFENGEYSYLSKKTMSQFVKLAEEVVADTGDWKLLSNALWKNREWQKAHQLTQFAEYLSNWCNKFYPDETETNAFKKWAAAVPKEQFIGKIKGLGPRAYEQLLWYIEGINSIKLDRHVAKFLRASLGPSVSESDGIAALKAVAGQMGVSATSLDARIWDYMQAQANA
ncbi:MAG: hypothetical protein ACRETN_07915 [Nevskiales bacterium]